MSRQTAQTVQPTSTYYKLKISMHAHAMISFFFLVFSRKKNKQTSVPPSFSDCRSHTHRHTRSLPSLSPKSLINDLLKLFMLIIMPQRPTNRSIRWPITSVSVRTRWKNTSTGKRNKLSQVRCGNTKRRTTSHSFAIRPALYGFIWISALLTMSSTFAAI